MSKCSASLNGKPISITWSKQETIESKIKEPADQETLLSTSSSSLTENNNKIENKINTLLSADEYDDDDSKSKEKALDTNESTNESTEQETEQKEFVDALFDDSTNYEQLLS